MATNYRQISASPDDVFRVLEHGWLYAGWVVGASRIRDVDAGWPAEGTKIEHSVGIWPMLIDDTTSMIEWEPPRHVRLRARGWPVGEAFVAFDVKPRGDGCMVRMVEDAVDGPGTLIPKFIRDIGLSFRNAETLRRLAYLAEGGAR